MPFGHRRRFLWALCLLVGASAATAAGRLPRNLFTEYLGHTEAETDAKLAAAWSQLFEGDEAGQRVCYPAGEDMAYILDVANDDIRSEGMSYGMMIAVQMNQRETFDRLWRWTQAHMLHRDGPRRGLYAWHCRRDGTRISAGSASDGEIWFTTALLFAAHRWSDSDGKARPPAEPVPTDQTAVPARPEASPYPAEIDYRADAEALFAAMLDDEREGEWTAIFDREERQVVFAPVGKAALFTDPSYHVPAFFELWAKWDNDAGRRAFWTDVTRTSRAFLHRAAHPQTGLMPEYASFDGTPFLGFGEHRGDFRFDAWRVLSNVALDHAWWRADPWEVEQSNRVLAFLASQGGPDCPNQFTLEGRALSEDSSLGLVAMAAVAGLAADRELAEPFVRRLWEAPIPEGHWRYYDGLLYFLGLLQVSGRFQILESPAPGC